MTDGSSTSRPNVEPFSFDEVFRAHFEYVWRSLRRLGVREADLEDLAHDVFVILHRKRDQYDPSRPLKPWLFGIAARAASDYRRRASHRREVLDADYAAPDERAPRGDDVVEAREKQRLVASALASLEETRLEVFVLHDVDGVAMPEIAEALGIPLNTGYSRLRLARQDFAAALKRLSRGGKR